MDTLFLLSLSYLAFALAIFFLAARTIHDHIQKRKK
jgi:hypothetical protein